MSTAEKIQTDPSALIRELDSRSIRDRLGAIERERKALLILLRAAIRNEKPKQAAVKQSA